MITGDITVVEGDGHEFIDVTCTLPPRYRCDFADNDTTVCQTAVSVTVAIDNDNDLTCFESGQKIPQAVVGRMDDDAFTSVCGVRCTADNW